MAEIGPLERYRRRKAEIDAAIGGEPSSTDYMRSVIRAAEALINGDKLIIFEEAHEHTLL